MSVSFEATWRTATTETVAREILGPDLEFRGSYEDAWNLVRLFLRESCHIQCGIAELTTPR
jgi:hypothetical protein